MQGQGQQRRVQEDLQQQLDRMQTTLQQVWCTEALSVVKHRHTDLAQGLGPGAAVIYRSIPHFSHTYPPHTYLHALRPALCRPRRS